MHKQYSSSRKRIRSIFTKLCGILFWLVALIFSLTAWTACAANNQIDLSENSSSLKKFLGNSSVDFHENERSHKTLVYNRIIDGFEQSPTPHADLTGARIAYWGWQQGEPFIKSFAIYNSSGKPLLVATAANLPNVSNPAQHSSSSIVDNQHDFDLIVKSQSEWAPPPVINIFSRGEKINAENFFVLRSWIAAEMLGSKTSCVGKIKNSCAFLLRSKIRTYAYNVFCLRLDERKKSSDQNGCMIDLPKITDSDEQPDISIFAN